MLVLYGMVWYLLKKHIIIIQTIQRARQTRLEASAYSCLKSNSLLLQLILIKLRYSTKYKIHIKHIKQ